MFTKKISIKNNQGVSGRYQITSYKAGTKEVLRKTDWIENLIMVGNNNGIGLITQHMAGVTTNPLEIDTAAIGTGATAPTDADTALGTAVLSNIVPTGTTYTKNSVTVSFFITDAELSNGTYSEFGIFANLKLFARSIISPSFTKATNEDTSIVYQINFSNS